MARIVLKDLVKEFGQFRAVKGINLDIQDGEFLIMVGPSGCGKTTTLNMISGLVTPTSGSITIGEKDVTFLEPGDRGLGMMFQDLALFPHMTVFENVAFGLRVKDTPESEIKARVQRAAEAVHITPLLSKRPGQCSGGEAQRVALARTLVTNPEVYLMDEPLSSLDAKLRIDMRTELKGLHKRLKGTFVYVTHDQAEAMTMADRIVVINGGRIEQLGEPLEIYRKPATRFVAGFFGMPTMNFLEGEIAASDGAPVFTNAAIRVPLDAGTPKGLDGRKVVLGIRSEHVATGKGNNSGEVRLVEPLGDSSLVFFEFGDATRLVAKVDPDLEFKANDKLTFEFEPGNCHLFDTETGVRLN